MNIDIVNPIEARKPRPMTLRIVRLSVGRTMPRRTSSKVESVIPNGLPTSRPNATPAATLVEKTDCMSSPANDTPALAMANTGMTTNDTNGCIACSSRCDGGMASRVSALMRDITFTCSSSRVDTLFGCMPANSRRLAAARFRYADSGSCASAGITKAASTAAMVACMPDMRNATHTPPMPSRP